jgi:hypothetical protein
MVELHKALEENSVCRSPLLEGHQTHEEVRGARALQGTAAEQRRWFAGALGTLTAQRPAAVHVAQTLLSHPNPLARTLTQPPLHAPHAHTTHARHQQLTGLYKLHIQHTEVPPNFATLLQLRELLGLATEESEALEKDVLREAASFSI